MDSSGYVTLSRQAGLMREMDAVANNIANVSTGGYRREGLIFSEFVRATGPDDPSVSMANAAVRHLDRSQGPLAQTGGTFDFAIEGDGFFLVETADGQALTRAGSFLRNADGELVAPDGARLLDSAGAPVFVPDGVRDVTLATDGTLSADGQPMAQVGLWEPADPADLPRAAGSRLRPEGGVQPAEGGVLMQGFLEGSNVDPILEIARMIEVQRAYEHGQSFLDREDERVRAVVRTLGQ